jgi:poly(3-hydroxybutyrate) depolymerase
MRALFSKAELSCLGIIMPESLRAAVANVMLFGVALVFAPAYAEEPGPLPTCNAGIEESSISGVSSGAFMAVQFAAAWSSVVKGVGIVAGGPYYCAQASALDILNGYTSPLLMATGPCMKGPPPDLRYSFEKANEKAASGDIDPTSGLSRQKIYLFHGANDRIVAKSVTDAAAEFYRHYLGKAGAGNLFYQTTLEAGHSQVVGTTRAANKLNSCAANQAPYINQCGYDQAGVILQHIYGALDPPSSGEPTGSLRRFSQAHYASGDPASLSMDNVGYVFVPKDCELGKACRVHVALHGCKQNAANIGALFATAGGYNPWADGNRIIVLYPQASSQPPFNPDACWDWWSYLTHDDSFVTKSGRQIRAIKSMLDALTAGAKPGDQVIATSTSSPDRVIVTDVSDTAAALAWTPVSGAERYRVFRAAGDGEFQSVGTVLGPSFGDTGLAPATSYRWRVQALYGASEGPLSADVTASTRANSASSPEEKPAAEIFRRSPSAD